MSELIISRVSPQELDGAIERAATEGWNPGLRDADVFYAVDPRGFSPARSTA